MSKEIIGVFCGSFNPPLYSHFSLAQQLLDTLVSKIIFVPVSSKYNKFGLVPDEHRYNMLKLICDKNPNFEVSNIEFNLPRQPYTLETLTKFQEMYPNSEIRLIIGTDNLKEFESWYKVDVLLEKFKVIVLSRDEDLIDEIVNYNTLLLKYKSSFLSSNSLIRTNLSSTLVRNLINNNKSVKYLLPDEIIDYININHLYCNGDDK